MSSLPFLEAMRSQPEQLEASIAAVRDALAGAELPAFERSMTLGVLAMGASRNSSYALASVLAAAGVRTATPPASELAHAAEGFSVGDYLLVVTESGRSPEPIAAARRAGHTVPRIGLTNCPQAQIGSVVDTAIGLGGFADSDVYTVGYTATLLAYPQLLAALGLGVLPDDLGQAPALVRSALSDLQPDAAAVASWVAEATSVDVVGQGVSFAAVAELGLMLREGPHVPSGVYETYEYLHGPNEAVSADSVVILFGDERETEILRPFLDAGTRVVLVTASTATIDGEGHDLAQVVRLPQGHSPFVRAVLEIVFAQLVIAESARLRGVVLEGFRFEGLGTKLDA